MFQTRLNLARQLSWIPKAISHLTTICYGSCTTDALLSETNYTIKMSTQSAQSRRGCGELLLVKKIVRSEKKLLVFPHALAQVESMTGQASASFNCAHPYNSFDPASDIMTIFRTVFVAQPPKSSKTTTLCSWCPVLLSPCQAFMALPSVQSTASAPVYSIPSSMPRKNNAGLTQQHLHSTACNAATRTTLRTCCQC